MSVKFSNNAVTTLSAGVSAGATSFTVASASTFPTLSGSDWTYVSLTSEVVKVTAISGTTFTCDATSTAHASGESVELRMTAELLNDFAEDTEALPLAGGTMTGDVSLGDNVKAKFGAGADLQIFHDSANSLLSNSTGGLIIRNNSDDKDIYLQSDDGSGGNATYLQVDGSTGSVNLRHYGTARLATTSTGIAVTGSGTFNTTGDSNSSKGIVINTSGTNFESDGGIIQVTHAGGGSTTGGYFMKMKAGGGDKFNIKGNGDVVAAGTVTATGGSLTIHPASATNTAKLNIKSNSNASGGYDRPVIQMRDAATTGGFNIKLNGDDGNSLTLEQIVSNVAIKRFKASSGGDISFYEDTGTTPKFFWDASAERLGIGTSTINSNLSVYNSSQADDVSLSVFRSPPAATGETQSLIKILKSSNDTASAYGGAIGGYLSQGVGSGLTLNTISGGTLSEAMRITSAGKVGIGTDTPSYDLDISKSVDSGSVVARVINTSSTGVTQGIVQIGAATSYVNLTVNGSGDYISLSGSNVNTIYSSFDTHIFRSSANAERLRITSTGNLGVGTSNPQSRIDVGGGYMANEQGRADHVANTMPSPYYSCRTNGQATIAGLTRGLGKMTLAYRVKYAGTTGDYQLMGCQLSGGYLYIGVDTSFQLYFYAGLGTGGVVTGITLDIDKWYDLVLVDNDTSVDVYINGVLVHTESSSPATDGSGTFGIMALRYGAYKLNGDISDYRIYNTALTADEVKELYSGASVPFKYKGASQTLLLDDDCADDDTGDWATDAYSSLVFDTDHYELVNSGAGHGANERFTTIAGKQYRLSIDLKDGTASGATIQLILRDDSGAGPIWNNEIKTTTASWVTHTITAIAGDTDGEFYIYPNTNLSGSNIEFKNVKITQIGAVAEYDGSSATTGTWYDKSGNGLDGTVTGATLENKVKALEVANFTSTGNVGIGTTSPYTKLDTTIDSAVEWTTANLSNSANRPNFALSLKNDDTSITGTEVHMLFSAGASGSGQHSIGVKRTGLNTGDMIFRRRTGGASSGESMRIHSNGNVTSKAQNVTTFTVSQRFTAPASSSGTYAIDINNLIGIGFGGTINYTVRVGGYAGAGSNGCTAAYTVGGYAGHSYSATNYDSYGAGTIRNGYASSTGTEYDDRGLGYHPCKNLGAYIANGDIFAFVPTGQKYGFAIKNGGAQAMTIVITVTGSHI